MAENKPHSEKLVQRLNEIFHDFDSDEYHRGHPEIFQQERTRWKSIGKRFFALHDPLNILDIGTGTGFVPITVGEFLKEEDTFTCTDVSEKILDVAKDKISKEQFKGKFKFVKLQLLI